MNNIKVKNCIPHNFNKSKLNILLIKFYDTDIHTFLNNYKKINKKNIYIIDNFIQKLEKGENIDLTHLFV